MIHEIGNSLIRFGVLALQTVLPTLGVLWLMAYGFTRLTSWQNGQTFVLELPWLLLLSKKLIPNSFNRSAKPQREQCSCDKEWTKRNTRFFGRPTGGEQDQRENRSDKIRQKK
jgi:hypothetical protein